MFSIKKEFIKYTDQIGITGSFICLVHCIITSGFMIGSSILSHTSPHHGHHHYLDIWGIIDLSMIAISGGAVYFSTKKCNDLLHKYMMWVSYSIYALTMLLKYFGIEPTWLCIVSYTMSFILIGGHIINIKKECSHS